jgi:hypothetical protein
MAMPVETGFVKKENDISKDQNVWIAPTNDKSLCSGHTVLRTNVTTFPLFLDSCGGWGVTACVIFFLS